MIIQDFFPGEAVKEFVQCYRIIHFEFDKTQQVPYKAYPPKPENCLHFFLRDSLSVKKGELKPEAQASVLFRGQQTSVLYQQAGSDFIDVQIVFQPTAIFRLFGLPGYELVNVHLDATLLFPKNITFAREELQHATQYHEMITIVERYAKHLFSLIRKDYIPADDVSKRILKNNGLVSVSSLAKNAFYSTKQFNRKFCERVGLNPKMYSRIARFNKAYNFRNRFPKRDWSVIASECGYADYQHLAKDYKEFTGLTPPEFHILESNAPENILGIAKPLYLSRFKIG